MEGCKFCGKSKVEAEKAIKEGVPRDKEKLKKRLEELKKIGFKGEITTKL